MHRTEKERGSDLENCTEKVAKEEHGGEGSVACVEDVDDYQEYGGAWDDQQHQ